jgi:hypothetical protein
MSWFALSDEERREWRQHPVTLAYFKSLQDQISDAKEDVISAMVDETEQAINRARRMAGRVDGFETAIKIMERDT